ncbi:MAG: FxLYD domain-containing protein [Methanomicrobiales archaeon]|nr:FxLYD domain-containing protein [Methanomicrobiales archaeon]
MKKLFLLLLISGLLLAAGCTSRTQYEYTGGPVTSATSARYQAGDIIQMSPTDPAYSPTMAMIVLADTGTGYRVQTVYRPDASSAWVRVAGRVDTFSYQAVETGLPNVVGHADPDILAEIADPSPPPITTPPAVSGRDRLQILDHEFDVGTSGYFVYVLGTAKNVGSDRITAGSVEAKFYDSNGNLVGNGADFIRNLDPGETWSFEIRYYDPYNEVESYKLGVGPTY